MVQNREQKVAQSVSALRVQNHFEKIAVSINEVLFFGLIERRFVGGSVKGLAHGILALDGDLACANVVGRPVQGEKVGVSGRTVGQPSKGHTNGVGARRIELLGCRIEGIVFAMDARLVGVVPVGKRRKSRKNNGKSIAVGVIQVLHVVL